jgi:hypothetical protein
VQLVPRGARGGLYILAAEGSGYLHNRSLHGRLPVILARRTGWERWQSLVDCSCLESSRACKRPGGSNPSRSATKPQVRVGIPEPGGPASRSGNPDLLDQAAKRFGDGWSRSLVACR